LAKASQVQRPANGHAVTSPDRNQEMVAQMRSTPSGYGIQMRRVCECSRELFPAAVGRRGRELTRCDAVATGAARRGAGGSAGYLRTFADGRQCGTWDLPLRVCETCRRNATHLLDRNQSSGPVQRRAWGIVQVAQQGHTPWTLVHPRPCVVASHCKKMT
jgi:hypothetical protein